MLRLKHPRRVSRGSTWPIALVLLLLLCIGAVGVTGAQDSPETFDPFTATTNVNVLRAEAQRAGTIRVIVGVQANYAAIDGLDSANSIDAAALDATREQISLSAQNNVLSTVRNAPGATIQVVRQFPYAPYMVLMVDAAGLDALNANPLVTSVANDALAMPDMNSSAGVIGASGASGAWAKGYTGSGFAVAVLDTGVDKAHPALSSRVVSEACFNTTSSGVSSSRCPGGVDTSTAVGSGVDCTSAFASGCEHGTHVAGTVASTDATYKGIAYDASIIAINVFSFFPVTYATCASVYADDCLLSYGSDQMDGLNHVYSLRNTYSIASVNMSLGGGQYFDEASCDSAASGVKFYVDLLRGVNIATVISSGNNGFKDSMGAPGCVSTAIGVGATTDADAVASFSNVASFMDVFAPGVDIWSAQSGTTGFKSLQGTSMSSPHVAGAWAVLRQSNPNADVSTVLATLQSTGVSVADTRSGGTITKPRIKLNDAVDDLFVPSAPASLTATAVSQTQINLSWGNVSNETGFRLERSPNGSSGWATVTTTGVNVTTYNNNSGLTCGTTYYYRVYAVGVNGDSPVSNVPNATTVVCAPSTPTGLSASAAGQTQINLTWTDVATETGYSIERSADGSAGWASVGTNAAGDTTFSHTGLTCGTTHYYRVIASNVGGNSAPSSNANATTVVCAPSTPTGLSASAAGQTQINLTWTDVSTETGYSIERSADGSTGWASVGTNTANDTTFSHTGLTCGTTHHYRVIASNAGGNSAASSNANATTVVCAPSTPTGLSATPFSQTQIDLTWTDVSTETGYSIERSADGSTGWASVGTNTANDTTFSHTGLTCGTTHHYRLIASNAGGNSAASGTANATTVICAPSTPTGLSATPFSQTQIDLTWTDVSTETGYSIERSADGSTGWASVGTNTANDTTFSHTGLTCGTTHHYRVIASNAGGNSAASSTANATTVVCAPSTPTGLSATPFSQTQIDLTWTDVSTETGYSIERSADGSTGWASVGTNTANDTTFSHTGLTCGTTHHYRVIASNAGGNSAASSTANATTVICAPAQPTGLSATAAGQTQIDLTWTDVSTETGYSIERSADGSTGWASVGTNTANDTTFSHTGLTCGTTHHYRVIASNVGGNSAASSTANATTVVCAPSTPTGLSATAAGQTQIDLTWTDVSTETGYTIEWSPNGSTGWANAGTNTANDTTFSHTGLVCNTTYHYRVTATNAGGNSAASSTANATTVVCAPAQPTGLSATPVSQTQIDLSWSDVSGETIYTVEHSDDGSTGWTIINVNPADATTFSHTGLTCGTTHHYRVIASNAGGSSAASSSANATTVVCAPAQPTGLSALPFSQTQIDLTWSDVSGETTYTVEHSDDGSTGWAIINVYPANITSYSHTGLTCNTTHHYRVIASNAGGDSAPSSTANATTVVCAPAQPTGLSATTVSTTQIDLSWTDGADETAYDIERSADGVSGWANIGTNAADDVTYSDTGLTCGTTYYYRVIASNAGGDSAASVVANATTSTCDIPDVEVLINGNFDDNDDGVKKLPDNWVGKGQLKDDGIRKDATVVFSHSAPNVFRFTGYAGEKNSFITQTINHNAHGIGLGDTLTFSVYIDQRSAKPSATVGKLMITYTDSSTPTSVLIKIPAVKTPGMVKISAASFTITNPNIKKIKAQLLYKQPTGKFYLDDASVLLTPGEETLNGDGAGGLVPLPAAPADLRGQ